MVLLLMLKRAFYLFCSFKNVLKVVCEESKSILHCFEGRFFQLHGEKISRSGEFTKKRSQSSKKKALSSLLLLRSLSERKRRQRRQRRERKVLSIIDPENEREN
jgi:hypothetical protein